MKTFIIFLIALGLPLIVFGITESPEDQYVYQFHLYYDNGQIFSDRDAQFAYEILSEEFISETVTTQFPYRGEIINFAGEVAQRFTFDPKQGDVNFLKGKIAVKATYVADGQKAVFYNAENQSVLTVSVSESSFCNDDGICNADRGEDSLSCPKDCNQALSAPPATTPSPPVGESGGLLSGILYTLAGLILAGLGWWYFKRRGKSDNMTLPPTPPLPTPPTPPNPGNTI